jgi:hypothetical protein
MERFGVRKVTQLSSNISAAIVSVSANTGSSGGLLADAARMGFRVFATMTWQRGEREWSSSVFSLSIERD